MDPWWQDHGDPWSSYAYVAPRWKSKSDSWCNPNDRCDSTIGDIADSLMASTVRAGASRQVAAAVAAALFHLRAGPIRGMNDAAFSDHIDMHDELLAVTQIHLGEEVGIAEVWKHLKGCGHSSLAKSISTQHRKRNKAAHPQRLLAERLEKALAESVAPQQIAEVALCANSDDFAEVAPCAHVAEGDCDVQVVAEPCLGSLLHVLADPAVAPCAKVAEGVELAIGADSAEAATGSDEDKKGILPGMRN